MTFRVCLMAVVLGSVVGCGGGQTGPVKSEPVTDNLKRIGRAYVAFAATKGRPPTSPADLVAQLQAEGQSEDVLTSPRDRQPFVILWGVPLKDMNSKPVSEGLEPRRRFPVLAFEKDGVGGSRYVYCAPNTVFLMTEAEFQSAFFPPGHGPQG